MNSFQVAHRPWPLPPGPWVMAQRWHNLLFAHWPLPPGALQPLIPEGLRLDTFDGQAWLGIVPFTMSGVRLRGTPAVPYLSAFPELNVRTYVVAGAKPGVYFFSLDAGNRLAVAVARAWFHLPYFRARMSARLAGDRVHYASRRTHRGAPLARFVGTYAPGSPVYHARPGTLEHWLVERYCLYTQVPNRGLRRGEIHHAPWPLQDAQANIAENSMAQAHGLALPDLPPLLHYAHRLDVVVWPLRPL
jgi:uncharacterized protein YqjF (DUF2071 family)